MTGENGFTVDLGVLRELSGRLVGFAERAGRQRDALDDVRADTGRADSDDAGVTGVRVAAGLVAALRDALRDDSGHVDRSAAHYADADLRIDEALRSIRSPAGLA